MKYYAVLFNKDKNITVTIPDDRFRHYRQGYTVNLDGMLFEVKLKHIDDRRKAEYTILFPHKGIPVDEGEPTVFNVISKLESYLLRDQDTAGENLGADEADYQRHEVEGDRDR